MMYYFAMGQGRHLLKHGPGETPRALAHHSQVSLLETLKDRHVEVCSVSLLSRDLSNPDEVLSYMVGVNAEPDVGGFRPLGEAELVALKMGAHRNKPIDQDYLNMLQKHPFARAGGLFTFPAGASTWLFTFLNYIYDIRRFYDKRLRKQNLQREFGLLTADNLTRFFKEQTTDEQTLRPMITFQAWVINPLAELSMDELEVMPEAFLQRERIAAFLKESKTNDDERAKQLAFWHVTVRFLKFVELLWIDGLGGVKFDPERFFLRRDEVDSFNNFITQIDLKVDNSLKGN